MLWEEIVDRASKMDVRPTDIFREEVQKAVLTSLSLQGCFDHVVFQGGTALRLFHGNPRFSEDLDLVLREGVEGYDLSRHLPDVGRFVRDAFPFAISADARVQKEGPALRRYVVRARTGVPQRDVRLHVELVPVPSHRHGPRLLDFPPFQPAVMVEEAVEILADKVCALAFRPYLKGRDLWDIHFLTTERSAEADVGLLRQKVGDYGHATSSFREGIVRAREAIVSEGAVVLARELVRFLPPRVMALYTDRSAILGSVLRSISAFEGAMEAAADEGR